MFVSLFLILIGSRAAIINYSGSSTPYLDEWDGDAAYLLKPYVRGNLTLGDLFSNFNEHVIFFTRLLVLVIFHVSGYWDVVLQMIVNAILASATIIAISYALSRVLYGRWALAAIVLTCLINAVPVSCDNILMGFNTHFYLLLTFSFASLWLLADSRAWSSRWVAGVLCAVASFLCMASGALTLAAVIGLHLLQLVRDRRRGRREWFGIAALVVATVALIGLVPNVPDSNAYRAHSMRQFLSAFYELASWPSPDILGWIVGLPSALFCLRTILDRPPLGDARWFNVAAFGWVLTQFVALAVGRGGAPIANRYLDMLLIGLAINLTSVFWLFESPPVSGRRKVWRALALAAWLVIVAVSLVRPERHLPEYLGYRRQTAEVQTQNLRSYLATGDASYLGGAPGVEIPYLVLSRLRQLLDTPEIRAALPPELLSKDTPRNWVEAFKRNFLGQGYTWLGSGILLLIAVIAWSARAAFRTGPGGGERAGIRLGE